MQSPAFIDSFNVKILNMNLLLILGYDPKKTVQDIMVEITRYLHTGPLLKIEDFKVSKEIHLNTTDKAVLIYKGMWLDKDTTLELCGIRPGEMLFYTQFVTTDSSTEEHHPRDSLRDFDNLEGSETTGLVSGKQDKKSKRDENNKKTHGMKTKMLNFIKSI